MYWNWVSTFLLVVACLFFVFGLLFIGDDGFGGLILWLIAALAVGGMFVNTTIHTENLHDHAANAAIRVQGLDVSDVDSSSGTATLYAGNCPPMFVNIKHDEESWQVYTTKLSGERVRITPAISKQMAQACKSVLSN